MNRQSPGTSEKDYHMFKLLTVPSVAGLLASMVPLSAQSSLNGPGDFVVERILTLNSIISPYPPSFPDQVLAGLKAGTIEIHQRFTYNSAQRTVDQLAFVVPAKSPVPFPD